MLDHNRNSYLKLLKYIKKLWCIKCCCCCFSNLFEDLKDPDSSTNNTTPQPDNQPELDTRTLGENTQTKQKRIINQSEPTLIIPLLLSPSQFT